MKKPHLREAFDENQSWLTLDGGYTLELLKIDPFPGSPEEASVTLQSVRLVVVGQGS